MVRKGALAISAALTVLVVGTVAGVAWGMRQGGDDGQTALAPSPTTQAAGATAAATILAPQEAVKAALAYTGGARADDVRLVLRDTGFAYEVQVGGTLVVVDAATGRVVKAEAGQATGADIAVSAPSTGGQGTTISAEEAQRIALTATGDRYVREVQLEREHGVLAYEVKTEGHEVYVDATTGQVLKLEGERSPGHWEHEEEDND